MIRSCFAFAVAAIFLGACGSSRTSASDPQVASAEARAEERESIDECFAEANQRYLDVVSGCIDPTCKAAAEQHRDTWYAECQ
jgi:hypothetical protein